MHKNNNVSIMPSWDPYIKESIVLRKGESGESLAKRMGDSDGGNSLLKAVR